VSAFIDELDASASHVRHAYVDFDGVILDSEPLQMQAYSDILARYGITGFGKKEFLNYIGNSEPVAWSMIIKDYELNLAVEDLIKERNEIYSQVMEYDDLKPNWFVKPFFTWLSRNKISADVVSANQTTYISSILERFEIALLVTNIYSLHEITPVTNKPDLLRKLVGDEGSSSLIIEDSIKTLEFAGSLGMFRVGVQHGYNEHLTLPAEIIVNTDRPF
jgi:beta-phosphoglucomutase-like phosphatase (HAD superfamily)